MKLEHIPYEPKSVCEGTRQAVRASCEEKDLYLTLELEQGHPLQIVWWPQSVATNNNINQKLVKRMLERLGHTPTIVEIGK